MHTLEQWITKAQKEDWCHRLWQKDASLWSQDLAVQKLISNRLGWLDAESFLKQNLAKLENFGVSIHPEVNHVVILGMGGSSLGTDVLRQVFQSQSMLVTVIDSTDADYVRQLQSEMDFSKTLFMVCSKSGNTLEVEALRKHFESLCKNKSQFLAITDPGTPLLESMSIKHGYQEPWINPPDIGGRFSVMSFFGMLPAAAMGLDLKKMYSRLRDMQVLCQKSDLTQNPGFKLGLFLGLNALVGRNKLTVLMPNEYASFGIWIEQLIAESTGKKGLGLLPVVNETIYQKNTLFDRCYINYRSDVSPDENGLTYAIEDPYDLTGEFFKWKIATAVAGMVLNINPFDEPDVNRSKDNTRLFIQPGAIKSYEDFLIEVKTLSTPIEGMQSFLTGLKTPEYGCLLAYLPYTSQNILQVDAWCKILAEKYQVPFVSGFGPRFLHSTGQFHKGGTNQGRFIQITCTNNPLPIHGWDFGFETLKLAQALGDFQAMKSCGRKVINIHLDTPQLPKIS